jgi:hypothetical protein
MNRFAVIVFLLLIPSLSIAGDKWKISPTKDDEAKFGVYIPKDIYDAHKELDKMLSIELKEEMKSGSEGDLIKYHFGLGRWMRNNWALWAGSNLSEWFNSQGIRHPDDMSGIILDSYFRHLRDEPLGLKEKCQYYIRYWKIREKPSSIPCEKGEVIFALTHSEIEKEYYYHVAQCGLTGKYLVYHHDIGWADPTEQMINRIEELKANEGIVSAPLVKPN